MQKLITPLLLVAALISWVSPAMAAPHLDLNVTLDPAKGMVSVKGRSSEPVFIPGETKQATNFDYNWPLPQTTEWRGGNFVSEKGIFLTGDWAPRSQELITYSMTLSAPSITVAPGKIMTENFEAPGYQATFVMDKPTEGIPLFSGPYKIGQLAYKNVMLRTYFYEDMTDMAQGYLQRTARYIERFEREIGPYPFDGFHIVAAPVPSGYGFAGLTYMGQRVLRLPFIKETSLGHEILHNYWGNGVFPDYPSGNWAEGLTSYMADYMTAEAADKQKARNMRLSWLREFSALPKELDQPVSQFKAKHSQASQVIGYHKAAFVFHMLRRQLGDATFFKGLRHFWQNHAFHVASWADLENSFSAVSAQDLSAFFTQWVQQTGAPTFKNLSAQARFRQGEGWEVTARVFQGQQPYQTQLPIAIGTGNDVIDATIQVKGAMAQSQIQIARRPMAISLDPDFHVFRTLGVNEAPAILKDVTLAKNVRLDILNKDLRETAMALAARMTDAKIHTSGKDYPFMLIGLKGDIENTLKKRGLPPYPMTLMKETTSQVWAAKLQNSTPYLVIAVSNHDALKALMRPLPHYGARSALQFNGRTATFKTSGQSRPLSVPIN